LAREVGVSGVLLAAAMGHESETTTIEHYAGRKAVQQAGIERVTAALHLILARTGCTHVVPAPAARPGVRSGVA
jgi:hypothetical protein